VTQVRLELRALAGAWRQVLVDDPTHARPIIASLLNGRVTITPMATAKHRWMLTGEGTLAGLFQRAVFPSGWRPQGGTALSYQPVFQGIWRSDGRAA
jgi:hypothetical protein